MHGSAIISTLSEEMKNKGDFDTVNYFFKNYPQVFPTTST